MFLKEFDAPNNKNNFIWKILNLFFLMLKRQVSSFTNIIVFAIPFITLISFSVVIPISMSYSLILGVILLSSTFCVYGNNFFTIRNSSNYKNMTNSSINLYEIYISIFLLVLFFNLFIVLSFELLIFVLFQISFLNNYTPVIGEPFLNSIDSVTSWRYNYSLTTFWLSLYYTLICTMLIFTVSVFFQQISGNFKNFITFSISFLILSIVFGGMLNPTYLQVSPFGEMLNGDFKINSEQIYKSFYNPTKNSLEILYYPSHKIISNSGSGNFTVAPEFSRGGSEFMNIISSLFPTYWINSFISSSSSIIFYDHNLVDQTFSFFLDGKEIIHPDYIYFKFAYFRVNNLDYLLSILWPYFMMIIFLLASLFLRIFGK